MGDSTDSYDRSIEAAAAAASRGDPDGIEQAETLYRKALTVGERARGPFDISLAPALTGLGAVLLQRGNAEEAAPILSRAVAIGEQQLGADHPDVVILLNDISRLYLRHGAHAHAEPLLQRLLEIKRVKGEEHPEVATVLASIASVRQTIGRHDEAEQLWRRVLNIRERTLAPNHLATASALEHLGLSCAARGKLHEALQLLQRALGMREITLGADHPSLRAVRERIADLQLQASDDLLDGSDLMPAPPVRPRLLVAPHLASPLASPPPALAPAPAPTPAPAPVPPTVSAPKAPVRLLENDPLPAPVVVPTSTALTVSDGEAELSPQAVPYLNVLMDIKDELDETEPAPASVGGWAATAAAVKVGLRERRAAVIGAVAAVLAVPAIGFGVASAMRDNRSPEWAQSNSYALVPQAVDTTLARASAPEALRPMVAAGDVQKDTVASAASTTSARPRTTESRPAPRPQVNQEPETPLLVQRPTVGRLDSVARSISVPTQNLGGSFEVQLQASLANAQRQVASELTPTTPARRARLIGSPPIPRYPPQLAKSNVGGEVKVRFDVDTLGRPVMGTFAVISSPHPAFAESVKKLVPTMRFEAARTAGPVPQPVNENVEMSFQFVPRGEE